MGGSVRGLSRTRSSRWLGLVPVLLFVGVAIGGRPPGTGGRRLCRGHAVDGIGIRTSSGGNPSYVGTTTIVSDGTSAPAQSPVRVLRRGGLLLKRELDLLHGRRGVRPRPAQLDLHRVPRVLPGPGRPERLRDDLRPDHHDDPTRQRRPDRLQPMHAAVRRLQLLGYHDADGERRGHLRLHHVRQQRRQQQHARWHADGHDVDGARALRGGPGWRRRRPRQERRSRTGPPTS